MGKKNHGMLRVECDGETFFIGPQETVTFVADGGERLCTLESLGAGAVRVYRNNSYWITGG